MLHNVAPRPAKPIVLGLKFKLISYQRYLIKIRNRIRLFQNSKAYKVAKPKTYFSLLHLISSNKSGPKASIQETRKIKRDINKNYGKIKKNKKIYMNAFGGFPDGNAHYLPIKEQGAPRRQSGKESEPYKKYQLIQNSFLGSEALRRQAGTGHKKKKQYVKWLGFSNKHNS